MQRDREPHPGASPKGLTALRGLARDLLGRQPQERLPRVTDYQRLLGVGSGTVQSSLQHLSDSGAVQLAPNGKRGTFLLERRLHLLWEAAGLGPVQGVLPLLVSGEWAGLATGLRTEFDKTAIPLQTLHVHGSYRRVEMVLQGKADFAVLSKEAAERTVAAESRDWTYVDLGPGTYYGPESLVVMLRPGLEEAMYSEAAACESVRRVGIDRTAYDHGRLTRAEFPEREGYVHVDGRYPYMPAAVARGSLDAAVWNRQMLLLPLESVGIPVRPLHEPESVAASRAMSNAVLFALRERPEVVAVLKALDREEITRIQEGVLAERIMPMY